MYWAYSSSDVRTNARNCSRAVDEIGNWSISRSLSLSTMVAPLTWMPYVSGVKATVRMPSSVASSSAGVPR